MPKLHVGTSGWNYDHWYDVFYPDDVPKKRRLEYYSGIFNTVEVNATFYRSFKQSTFQKWYDETPERFTWAVKAVRYITHQKRLQNVEDSVEMFIDSIQPLKEKTGPLLFQLPPSLQFDRENTETFIKLLPSGYRYVIEGRHNSWAEPGVQSLLRDNNIAWCISDTAGKYPYVESITADFTYIRLHGSKKLYASCYTDNEIQDWAEKIRDWDVDTYVYFDNDANGYAPLNAASLIEECRK